jgi:hypothetical protein
MALIRQTLALLCVGLAAMTSTAASDGLVAYTFPKGWFVEKQEDGVLASPSAGSFEKSISVQSCSRGKRNDCPSTCDIQLLQRRFLFTTNRPTAILRSRTRADGTLEIRESGDLENMKGWLSTAVLCGDRGTVVVGSTSLKSREEADQLVDELLGTIVWNRQSKPLPSE